MRCRHILAEMRRSVKREATNGRGRAFFHNRSFLQGAASSPGRERASRGAAAVLRDDARFQRAREPVERDRARRAVRGYARRGARQARLVMTALRSMDVDSLARQGASGRAAPDARTVKPPQTRAIGSSIPLGKSKLSS